MVRSHPTFLSSKFRTGSEGSPSESQSPRSAHYSDDQSWSNLSPYEFDLVAPEEHQQDQIPAGAQGLLVLNAFSAGTKPATNYSRRGSNASCFGNPFEPFEDFGELSGDSPLPGDCGYLRSSPTRCASNQSGRSGGGWFKGLRSKLSAEGDVSPLLPFGTNRKGVSAITWGGEPGDDDEKEDSSPFTFTPAQPFLPKLNLGGQSAEQQEAVSPVLLPQNGRRRSSFKPGGIMANTARRRSSIHTKNFDFPGPSTARGSVVVPDLPNPGNSTNTSLLPSLPSLRRGSIIQ